MIVTHDPFTTGIELEQYLKHFNHKFIMLNVKSEGIEYEIIKLLNKYNITNYFFLDCSFPMIYKLTQLNENNIALRFSEYESIDTILNMKNKCKYVWIDCFTNYPLTITTYNILKQNNFKLCF